MSTRQATPPITPSSRAACLPAGRCCCRRHSPAWEFRVSPSPCPGAARHAPHRGDSHLPARRAQQPHSWYLHRSGERIPLGAGREDCRAYLAPYLANHGHAPITRDELRDLDELPADAGIDVDAEHRAAVTSPSCGRRRRRWEEYRFALEWLDRVEALDGALPGEYEQKRARWARSSRDKELMMLERRILVGVDCPSQGRDAVALAVAMAGPTGAELLLAHVSEPQGNGAECGPSRTTSVSTTRA